MVGREGIVSLGELRGRVAIGLTVVTALVLAICGSANAAFSISTFQSKKVRVTSQGMIRVDIVDCSGCSGPVTVKRAKGGDLLGKGSLEDAHSDYGAAVKLKSSALKQIEKAGAVKVTITAKPDGVSNPKTLTAKALPPLDFANPCEVITHAEVEYVLGAPTDPGDYVEEAARPEIDDYGCGWARKDFKGILGLTTTRGDFAVYQIGRSPYGFGEGQAQTIEGPWDDAVLWTADESYVFSAFQALRGDDLVTLTFPPSASERAIAVTPAVLDSFPG